MDISESYSTNIIYINNKENSETTPFGEEKITTYNNRLYRVLDGKIGIHEDLSIASINKAAKMLVKSLPLIAATAFIPMFLASPMWIAPSILVASASLLTYIFKNAINSQIDKFLPNFSLNGIKNSRKQLLSEDYKPGTLGKLNLDHSKNLYSITAYLTPNEFKQVFAKEAQNCSFFELNKHFNLSQLADLYFSHLRDPVFDSWLATFKPLKVPSMLENEAEEIIALISYIEAYSKDHSLPSPKDLLNYEILPKNLSEYISTLQSSNDRKYFLTDSLFPESVFSYAHLLK